MNVLHLKALLTAIETGSISAAARKLGKKQPQVSQWISDLEIDLGVSFFERSGNKTKLTEEGALLLPHLSHTLSQLDNFVQSAEILAKEEPTTLHIAIENYVPDAVFIEPVSKLLEDPLLNVVVHRGTQEQIHLDLAEGDIDIAITHESGALHHLGFQYARLGHYDEVLVCSPSHPLAQLSIITSQNLIHHRELVWGEGDQEEGDGHTCSHAMFADLSMLVSVLKKDVGFAFLPEAAVKTLLQSGELRKLNCDFEQVSASDAYSNILRKVELCWRNGLLLSSVGTHAITLFKSKHNLG